MGWGLHIWLDSIEGRGGRLGWVGECGLLINLSLKICVCLALLCFGVCDFDFFRATPCLDW